MSNYQPTGGIIFHEAALNDRKEDIEKMRRVAWAIHESEMPSRISVQNAQELIDKVTRAANEFQKRASVIINDSASAGVRPAMKAAALAVKRAYDADVAGTLQNLVNQARAQGIGTVPSFRFNHRDVHLTLLAISNGYESLALIESYKPWFIKMMPSFMIGMFVSVGRVVEKIIAIAGGAYEGLKKVLDDTSTGIEMLISVLKWGSVAGGLYLLYRALEPKKAKS